MTDKEILFKAIKKAEKHGYKNSDFHYPMCREQSDNIIKYYWASPIIFSPDFAKAFFNDIYGMGGKGDWQCYQHKMLDEVQERKNPLKYLEKFL